MCHVLTHSHIAFPAQNPPATAIATKLGLSSLFWGYSAPADLPCSRHLAAFFFFKYAKCCPAPEFSHLLPLWFQCFSDRCPLCSLPSPIPLSAQSPQGGLPEPPFQNHGRRFLAPWSHFLVLHLIAWHYLCFVCVMKDKLEIFTKPPPRCRRVRRNKKGESTNLIKYLKNPCL